MKEFDYKTIKISLEETSKNIKDLLSKYNESIQKLSESEIVVLRIYYMLRKLNTINNMTPKGNYYDNKKEKMINELKEKIVEHAKKIYPNCSSINEIIARVNNDIQGKLSNIILSLKNAIKEEYKKRNNYVYTVLPIHGLAKLNASKNRENQYLNSIYNGVFAVSDIDEISDYVARANVGGMIVKNNIYEFPANPFSKIEGEKIELISPVSIYMSDVTCFEPQIDFDLINGKIGFIYGGEWVAQKEQVDCIEYQTSYLPSSYIDGKEIYYYIEDGKKQLLIDYKKINRVVREFIDNNSFNIETLPIVTSYAKKVLEEPFIESNNKYTRKIDINESIKIIYNFLLQLDQNMANQFQNIISSKDENNKPYISILPGNGNLNSEAEGPYARIYYDNTPNDCFRILHEILHVMNDCKIVDENNTHETLTRQYLGELVSITGEMLLGNYMVENGIIIIDELNYRKNWRLEQSKENARDIIVENELIKLYRNNNGISDSDIKNIKKNITPSSIEEMVIDDEIKIPKRTASILRNGKLNITKSKRYVIAQALLGKFLSRKTAQEDFVKLHYEVGNKDSDIIQVYNEIIENNKTK